MDQAVADQASAQAKVLQAQAALQSAELDLGYTTISSPIAGRISQARYSVGSLVGPGSDPLASVTSLDPIYIAIAVSEKDLLEARRQGIDLENPPVAPFLTLSDGSQYARDGRFDYLDSRVNQSTDTITARAVFPNPERILVPGQFVTVTVRQKQPVSAIVVPQAAVQRDQQGYFVLVVDQANQVEVRRIEVGDQTASDWVISQGLAAGERVIVQGIQKVRPDMVVNPVTAGN
jgi:membrane fusion protein (multidrug efflux system)